MIYLIASVGLFCGLVEGRLLNFAKRGGYLAEHIHRPAFVTLLGTIAGFSFILLLIGGFLQIVWWQWLVSIIGMIGISSGVVRPDRVAGWYAASPILSLLTIGSSGAVWANYFQIINL